MKTMSGIAKGLFEGVMIGDAEKELLELAKLSDDELYCRIGVAGRETLSTLRPGSDYMKSPNLGDATGKSPFFFRSDKVETPAPAISGNSTMSTSQPSRRLRCLSRQRPRCCC